MSPGGIYPGAFASGKEIAVVVKKRLLQTLDGRVVDGDDPSGAFLFAVPGQEIPDAVAREHGLLPDEKQGKKPKDKQRKPGEDKGSTKPEDSGDSPKGEAEKEQAE